VLKRFLFISASCLILAQGQLQARIGESEAQCIERYGKPVRVLEKGLLFVKDSRRIYITFSNGLADCIFVQKLDPDFLKRALPLPEPEIKQFLSENSHGCVWKYSSNLPDGDKIWVTNGSELGALYSQATCSLQVYTRENIVR
jgi:hypothetical protein